MTYGVVLLENTCREGGVVYLMCGQHFTSRLTGIYVERHWGPVILVDNENGVSRREKMVKSGEIFF